jgi:RND family efflux transporter MFP subunit
MTSHSRRFRWFRFVLILLLAGSVGAGAWFAFDRGRPLFGASPAPSGEAKAATVSVEVIAPQPGGIDRVCVQPGTVEPFESADLYAKTSGFLSEQVVDIGSRVKKGDVLARIAVPEYEKQVERDRARVKSAEAKVRQMEAHLTAAESEAKSADASVALANVLVRAKKAYRLYREKQLNRYKELVAQRAIEQRVVDEQEDFYLSAQEAENAAKEGVNTAVERLATARAKITQARADVEQAKAEVGVAAAELEKSQVLIDYAAVKAPYTGVVTRRNFHIGAFIKSVDQGATLPLLTVERLDLMRLVVQVPDRDVPYVSVGDPAVFEVDSLDKRVFQTRGIARSARAQDQATRMMRVEVDVPNPTDADNPDGVLTPGMYGRATLVLRKGAATAVRVPTAVVSRGAAGKGTVRLLRGDHIQTVPVTLGADNGVEVEVLAGLTPAERVVVRTSGPVGDGAAVAVAGTRAGAAGH